MFGEPAGELGPGAGPVGEAGPEILDWLRAHVDDYVDLLRALASLESPSSDPDAQRPVFELLRGRLEDLGFAVQHVAGQRSGGHLEARSPTSDPDTPVQMILGHCDTVWPKGILRSMPLRREGDLVFVDNNVYAIPDNDPAGVSSSLAVPAVDVTDVVVEITFAPEHAWLGDMIATLTYDDGIGGIITADLFARVGRGEQITSGSPFGNGNDMNGLYRFGDAFLLNLWTEPAVGGDQPQGDYRASTNNNSGLTTYPDNGTFVDLNTVFGGPKAAGTWTLKIADVGAALTGSFSWKLVLNGGGDSPCAADCACLGDTDASLTLDGNDVASFTQAILDGNGECADVNEDTFVNLDDVDPFVMKLIMGETCE